MKKPNEEFDEEDDVIHQEIQTTNPDGDEEPAPRRIFEVNTEFDKLDKDR